jgi:hypothetical protein
MNKINRSSVATIAVCLMFLFAADEVYAQSIGGSLGGWRENHDRPGMDYKSFDLRTADPLICKNRCAKDPKCRAWAYVKPGYQGQMAKCWLKSGVPPAVANECCISGLTSSVELCEPLSFASTSPIPPTVIGGHYSHQIQTSGGDGPVQLCPLARDPSGRQAGCDNSPDQRWSMPPGLTLSKTGMISGQVKCQNPERGGTSCGAGYLPLLIQAWDSCPQGTQTISQEFWIDVKPEP